MGNTIKDLLDHIAAPSNLRAAWQRVHDNQGCAGVDGISIQDFETALDENLSLLANQILQESYHPRPLMRILVDKGNGEARALCVPVIRDRVAQAAALNVLEPVFEKEFEDCSFAYRKGRSVRQAVLKVREFYEQGYRWVLDADIDAFFDSVPHHGILSKLEQLMPDKNILRLLNLWIKAEIWDGSQVFRLRRGIPQGSGISPMLANLYLDELDEELLSQGLRLVRYADDFLVLCKSEAKAQEAVKLTEAVLERMELELDEADIVHFDQGFRFLGLIFCRSVILKPFDTAKKEKHIIYMPPLMDIK